MSYNFSLGILPETNLDALPIVDDAPRSFDDAAAGGAFDLVGAQVGPHVVLVDPLYGDGAKSLANGLGRQVYVVSFGGVADTYAIEAAGGLERLRAQTAGELVQDQGAPLAAEAALGGHAFPEDAHVAVFEALLGADLAGVFDASFVTVISGDDLMAGLG